MKKLTIKEVFFVLIIYALGIVYILTDQFFVPKNIRLITLILVQVIMYVTIYTKIKSNETSPEQAPGYHSKQIELTNI